MKKYKTVLEDDIGRLYELDGVTPYVPAGTTETEEVSEDNKNNSGTDLKDIKRKTIVFIVLQGKVKINYEKN